MQISILNRDICKNIYNLCYMYCNLFVDKQIITILCGDIVFLLHYQLKIFFENMSYLIQLY